MILDIVPGHHTKRVTAISPQEERLKLGEWILESTDTSVGCFTRLVVNVTYFNKFLQRDDPVSTCARFRVLGRIVSLVPEDASYPSGPHKLEIHSETTATVQLALTSVEGFDQPLYQLPPIPFE